MGPQTYVYVYMSICLYVYMSIYIYIYVYTYVYLYVYMSICLYVYMYICLYVYMSICMYTRGLSGLRLRAGRDLSGPRLPSPGGLCLIRVVSCEEPVDFTRSHGRQFVFDSRCFL